VKSLSASTALGQQEYDKPVFRALMVAGIGVRLPWPLAEEEVWARDNAAEPVAGAFEVSRVF
jgi:hypothetical protein